MEESKKKNLAPLMQALSVIEQELVQRDGECVAALVLCLASTPNGAMHVLLGGPVPLEGSETMATPAKMLATGLKALCDEAGINAHRLLDSLPTQHATWPVRDAAGDEARDANLRQFVGFVGDHMVAESATRPACALDDRFYAVFDREDKLLMADRDLGACVGHMLGAAACVFTHDTAIVLSAEDIRLMSGMAESFGVLVDDADVWVCDQRLRRLGCRLSAEARESSERLYQLLPSLWLGNTLVLARGEERKSFTVERARGRVTVTETAGSRVSLVQMETYYEEGWRWAGPFTTT